MRDTRKPTKRKIVQSAKKRFFAQSATQAPEDFFKTRISLLPPLPAVLLRRVRLVPGDPYSAIYSHSLPGAAGDADV